MGKIEGATKLHLPRAVVAVARAMAKNHSDYTSRYERGTWKEWLHPLHCATGMTSGVAWFFLSPRIHSTEEAVARFHQANKVSVHARCFVEIGKELGLQQNLFASTWEQYKDAVMGNRVVTRLDGKPISANKSTWAGAYLVKRTDTDDSLPCTVTISDAGQIECECFQRFQRQLCRHIIVVLRRLILRIGLCEEDGKDFVDQVSSVECDFHRVLGCRLTKVSQLFVWHVVPKFMEAISKTPWKGTRHTLLTATRVACLPALVSAVV